MAAPAEEPGSTGVAVVNSSDFLLLCLCIAAAVSLWKLLLHRRRIHNRDEVKRKGSCPTSTLRRSQSPPQPRELCAPRAKSRSTIVFDEWDGLCTPLLALSSIPTPPLSSIPAMRSDFFQCHDGSVMNNCLHFRRRLTTLCRNRPRRCS
jgi:hypothetical protein